MPPRSACASAVTQGAEMLSGAGAAQLCPSQCCLLRECSAAAGASPPHPALLQRGCWQPQPRLRCSAPSTHSQHSRVPPDRTLSTLFCYRQPPGNTIGSPCLSVSHRHQPLAMGKGEERHSRCVFSDSSITLSLTVPIWFVRHSFPYSLLYLAHSWSATCRRRAALGTHTPVLSPPHTVHLL